MQSKFGATHPMDPDAYPERQDDDPAAVLDEPEDVLPLRTVELGAKGRGRIFAEADSRHPGGQALVVDGVVAKVYPTRLVNRALADRILKETGKPVTPPRVSVAEVIEGRPLGGPSTLAQEATPAGEKPATPAKPAKATGASKS